MANKNDRYYSYSFTYFLKFQDLEIFEGESLLEKSSLEYELQQFNNFIEVEKSKFKYFHYQVEKCPKTSRLHIQGFLYYKDAKSFSSTIKLFKKYNFISHIEYNRGNVEECYKYTNKSDSLYQPTYNTNGYSYTFGSLPSLEEERNNKGSRTDIVDFINAIYRGDSYYDMLDNFPNLMLKYDKFYEKHKKVYLTNKYMNSIRTMKNELYTGVIYQDDLIKSIYEKYGFDNVYRLPNFNKFAFDDYNGQDVILIDNYKDQFFDDFLTRLCSGYPLYLGARYESKIACFTKVIVITSYDLMIFNMVNHIVDEKILFQNVKEY